jgi:hypothetical protein
MVFGKTFGRKARRSRPPYYRPHVWALEDRTLLSFLSLSSYATGDHPRGMAVGDFTGDGINDLAVAFNGGVSVLLGNGVAPSRPPSTMPRREVPARPWPWAISTAMASRTWPLSTRIPPR